MSPLRTSAILSPSPASCPLQDGYVVHRESKTCFRPVESPLLKWTDARDKCAIDGETLAILEPVEKLEFLVQYFRANPTGQCSLLTLQRYALLILIAVRKGLILFSTSSYYEFCMSVFFSLSALSLQLWSVDWLRLNFWSGDSLFHFIF